MARNPIEIPLASETRAFRQGIDSGVIDPLEDAVKALDELGKSRGPDQLEDDLRRAQRTTDSLADETKDAARIIEREYKDAYRGARQAADDGLDGMNQRTQEVTGELRQNLGETFSSFRGDLEDLPQIAQDTLGGLAGSGALGGIAGIAAGAAGAAGLGLITAEMQRQQEEAERLRERLSGLYQAAVEEGRTYLNQSQIVAEINSIIFDPDRAAEWKQLQEDANTLGLDRATVLSAQAGSIAEQEVVLERVNQLLGEEASTYTTLRDGIERTDLGVASLRDRWESVSDATREQKQNAEDALAITSEQLLSAARDAKSAEIAVDDLGNKLVSLEDGTEFVIDAHTGQATQDVQRFKGDVDALPKSVVTNFRADIWEVERAIQNMQGRTVNVRLRSNGSVTLPGGRIASLE
jgi:hypothetical protein